MVAAVAPPAAARRPLWAPAAVAVACAAVTGWLGMAGGYLWTDYEYANLGPFAALTHGDLGRFFGSAPIEGPSLLLRAPFAFLPSLWGGGAGAIFRAVAIPGLLAAVVLAVLTFRWTLHRWGTPRLAWLYLVLIVANPIYLNALAQGHPEEILGAVLCVGAVLAALRDRSLIASILLGLALANKAWAVLAIGPVLLALERDHLRTVGVAIGIAALAAAPFLLDSSSRASLATAGTTETVFQPWQIWWFLGEHGHVIRGFSNVLKPDYRAAPGWIAPLTHPLIAALGVPAALAWARLRRGRSADLLLLLAVLLLARCVLDAADNVYYHVPFLVALGAWEARRSARPPVLTLAATACVWLTCVKLPGLVSPDWQSAAYLAWALPALAVITRAAFASRELQVSHRLVVTT